MTRATKKASQWVAFALLSIIGLTTDKVQAQSDPTFEQTVSYIIQNTKGRVMYPGDLDAYSRTTGYHLKDIKIEQNGKIELITDQKNDYNNFNIIFNIFDLVEKVDYPDGIRAYKFLVHFNGLNVSKGYGITFATDADAQKIARAFRHLKKVCTKENDLFSQIPEEDKKVKLTKEETIEYINKMIRFDEPYKNKYASDNKRGHTSYYYAYYNKGLTYNSSTNLYKFKISSYPYTWDHERGQIDYSNDAREYTVKFANYKGIDIFRVSNSFRGGNDTQLLRIYFNADSNTDGIVEVYFPIDDANGRIEGAYAKELKRLAKAFERLKELDSDEKDPFDD